MIMVRKEEALRVMVARFFVAMGALSGFGFVLLWAAVVQAGDGTGITGSAHDFTAQDWYPSVDKEVCNVCHAPHDKGRDRYKEGLLWNHALSSATYVMYSNAFSETQTHAVDSQPTGNSKLCLSCHDGTVALDSFDRYSGDMDMVMGNTYPLKKIPRVMSGSDLDMRGTHPISVSYAGDDPEMHPDSNTWPSGRTIAQTLEDGKVQCATCHDVHNGPDSMPGTMLLRAGNIAGLGGPSALCLTCHNK